MLFANSFNTNVIKTSKISKNEDETIFKGAFIKYPVNI